MLYIDASLDKAGKVGEHLESYHSLLGIVGH
jgi:hypothetical protein